jgi:hypothetical protein
MSSQPELIAQSIAGAVTDIAKGALGGITANLEKKEEEEREKRKFAHEAMLYGVKKASETGDFLQREEAKFISENSGKPGFARKLSEFRAAQSRVKDTVPDRPQKQDEVVEPPLPELEAEFDKMWNEANISGIRGHRDVGGYRASMYNALPLESVQALVDVMKEFEKKFA